MKDDHYLSFQFLCGRVGLSIHRFESPSAWDRLNRLRSTRPDSDRGGWESLARKLGSGVGPGPPSLTRKDGQLVWLPFVSLGFLWSLQGFFFF